MENIVKVSGLIVKSEKLIPVDIETSDHACIAEASNPYANYYGQVPQKAAPNSLFFFTQRFYYLEEIKGLAHRVKRCLSEKINLASATIDHKDKHYPAIRIKHFPDYKQLPDLHSCLYTQRVKFAQKPLILGEVTTRISKFFTLKETEPGFFMDGDEENEGYFTHTKEISGNDLISVINRIRNSTDCKLFDAAYGAFIYNGEVTPMIRIYAEGIDLALLKCIKKEFEKLA